MGEKNKHEGESDYEDIHYLRGMIARNTHIVSNTDEGHVRNQPYQIFLALDLRI